MAHRRKSTHCLLVVPCTFLIWAAAAETSSLSASEKDGATAAQPGLLLQEFIYNDAPFAQCHASTIEESKHGLVAAWFGGTREKNADVSIWLARKDKGAVAWTKPVEIDDGVVDGKDHPCWNPVLFQPTRGPLLLFYKVGPSPSTWWGMLVRSDHGGKSWSAPERLPEGILGPIKNNPVQLEDGTILSGSSTEHDGWRVHLEASTDLGRTWKHSKALNDGKDVAAIQPTILKHGKRLQILCRTRQGKIAESWSDDGRTWSELALTELPNPNSGIDAVTLADGRQLLVYNHTRRGRSPLNVAVSEDGKTWQQTVVLEDQPGEYSYPAVIQSDDGKVHVTYTWKRRKVKHVVLDPEKLAAK